MRDNFIYQSTIVSGGRDALCDFLNKLRKFEVTARYIIPSSFSYMVIYQYYRHISDNPDDLPIKGDDIRW